MLGGLNLWWAIWVGCMSSTKQWFGFVPTWDMESPQCPASLGFRMNSSETSPKRVNKAHPDASLKHLNRTSIISGNKKRKGETH